MKRLLLLLPIILLFSCTSTKQVMDSWKGHKITSLEMSWGPAHRVVNSTSGNKIYIYGYRKVLPGGGIHTTSGSSYRRDVYYYDTRYFWVNSSGVIYHWMVRREQIPPTQLDVSVWIR